jgi:hypothetical protein
MTIFCQNANNWDRYEAEERGEEDILRPPSEFQVGYTRLRIAISAWGQGDLFVVTAHSGLGTILNPELARWTARRDERGPTCVVGGTE